MPDLLVAAPTTPASGLSGQIWVDPASGIIFAWTGSVWKSTAGETVTLSQAGLTAANFAVTGYLWTCPTGETWQMQNGNIRYGTAGGSGCVLTITVDTATTAAGAGTAQFQSTIDCTATADTVYQGTMLAAGGTIMTAGTALSMKWAGTVTGLAKAAITVELLRLR